MTHRITILIIVLFCSIHIQTKIVVVSSATLLQESVQGQQVLKNIDAFENKTIAKLDEQKASVVASEQEIDSLDVEFAKELQAAKNISDNLGLSQKNMKMKEQALKQAHAELKTLQDAFNKKTQEIKQYIDGYYQKTTHSFFYSTLKKYAHKFGWDVVVEKEKCEFSSSSLDVTSKILQQLTTEIELRSKKYNTLSQVRLLFESLGLVYLDTNVYDKSLLPEIERREKEYCAQHQEMMNAYLKKYGAQVEQKHRAPFCVAWVSDIVGWGVFATHDIAQGDLIQEYTGEVALMTPNYDTTYAWNFLVLPGMRQMGVDSLLKGNEMRFVNHSNHPNLECITMLGRDKHCHICYVAKAHIKAGEQLFISYGNLYWVMRPYYEEMVD